MFQNRMLFVINLLGLVIKSLSFYIMFVFFFLRTELRWVYHLICINNNEQSY